MTTLLFILPDKTIYQAHGETVPRVGEEVELLESHGWPKDPVGVYRVTGVTHHYRRSSYSTATLSLELIAKP